MSKSGWMIARSVKYLGMPGLAGLALLVLAAAVFLGVVLPSEARLERATSEAAELQNRSKTVLANPEFHPLSPESGLDSFYKLLPPEQSAVMLMEKIYKSAGKESLVLKQGEYKFSRGKAGHMGSYQITLPVKGSYIQVRKFIAKVMNGMPTVALDGVDFKRDTIGGSDLEAKVQFTLFLGAV